MTLVAVRPGPAGLEARLGAFIGEMARAAWFAACGEPLTEGECRDTAACLAAFGFPDHAIAPVSDWWAAALVTQRADWSRAWWDAEAKAEAQCKAAAGARFGEPAFLAALSRVTDAAAALQGVAAVGLSRGGVADQALMRVAAGSAAQACHQAALACVLAEDAGAAHGFILKYRLFAAGRWPLGLIGERFHLF